MEPRINRDFLKYFRIRTFLHRKQRITPAPSPLPLPQLLPTSQHPLPFSLPPPHPLTCSLPPNTPDLFPTTPCNTPSSSSYPTYTTLPPSSPSPSTSNPFLFSTLSLLCRILELFHYD